MGGNKKTTKKKNQTKPVLEGPMDKFLRKAPTKRRADDVPEGERERPIKRAKRQECPGDHVVDPMNTGMRSASAEGRGLSCYAMGPLPADVLRLTVLKSLCKDVTILAINDYDDEFYHPHFSHVSADFRERRGLKRGLRPDTVGIVLDYNWLARGYYTARYGLKWASFMAEAFMGGTGMPNRLEFVLLPNPVASDEVTGMIARARPALKRANVVALEVTPEDAILFHPLIRATEFVCAEISRRGEQAKWKLHSCYHDFKFARYVDPQVPFIALQKKDGRSWQDACRDLLASDADAAEGSARRLAHEILNDVH